MVKLEQIQKIFKSDLLSQPFVALDKVSFEIPNGALVGFLGANGAGKTTSLKIIMDFIRADSGAVVYDSKLGSSKMDIFRRIGFLPERPYFYPNLTGQEFLMFLGKLSETPKEELVTRIKDWTPRFGIEHALNRALKTYSKGMLQRIGFLASMLHNPDFIILDEPLSGLDPVGRKELKDVISDLHKNGKTIFFSSHVVSDIEEICDRVIFLEKGKLVYDGSVQSLIHHSPTTDFTVKVMGNRDTIERAITNKSDLSSISDLGSGYFVLKIPSDAKQRVLPQLIQNAVEVISLEIDQPTLEEIFYKIKSK